MRRRADFIGWRRDCGEGIRDQGSGIKSGGIKKILKISYPVG